MSSDQEAQQDELLALASIYDDNTFSVSEEGEIPGGQFSALLELPQPFTVQFSRGTDQSKKTEGEPGSHDIQFLPPITLYFQLPINYPSEAPPTLTLACQWLTHTQLSHLCEKLDSISEENKGEVVLFLWTSFLKDEVLEFLEIGASLNLTNIVAPRQRGRHRSGSQQSNSGGKSGPSERADERKIPLPNGNFHQGESCSNTVDAVAFDTRAIQDIASQDLLLPTILEHDKAQREFVFRTTLFTCQVCFLEKLGVLCMRFLGCDHVYCKECMKGYFVLLIEEGNVLGLTCPNDQCESQAHPSQVKELVGAGLYTRYDRLLLQSSLDTMSDIMYCPRKSCECPVLVDQDSNMAHCPECHLAFCIFCKLVYHGVSPCKLKAEEVKRLREEYLEASASQKKDMERRYGRQCIRQIIEDSFTEEWLQQYSKKCPHCSTNIQKIDGCNKMTCTKCRSFFCWLCSASIPRNNPYGHFSNPNSECFNKLFLGMVIGDDMDWEEEQEPEWI